MIHQGCEHYSEPLCAGIVLSSSMFHTVLSDTGGVWQEFEHAVATPAAAASALCGFDVARSGDFTLFIDDAVLAGPIFTDGFESGDTSSWSSTATP